jgi:hypothetical protein
VDGPSPEHLLDYTPQTDHLATSVLRSLSRSFYNQYSIGPVRAALLGWSTFGLAPLWRMRRQFRAYITIERQQLWHLGEWLRHRRGGEQAVATADSVSRLHYRRALWMLATVCTFAVTAMVVGVCLRQGWDPLLQRTYHFRKLPPAFQTRDIVGFFLGWNVLLSAASLFHWAQLRAHFSGVRNFAERFNAVAVREGVKPIPLPQQRIGMTIPWAIAAVLLTVFGALWSVPMSLAAASQRRYINTTAAALRAQLGDRTRSMLLQRRPAVSAPSYTIHGRRCLNQLCRAQLPAGANYCPRCGGLHASFGEVA